MPPPTQGIISNVAKIVSVPTGLPPMQRPPMMPPPHQFMPPGMPMPGMPLPMGMRPPPGMPPMGMPHGGFMLPPQPMDDGPPSKRPREETLEPEGQWLRKVSGQITVRLSTPQTDEWDLKGRTFDIQLDITSTVHLHNCINIHYNFIR